MTSNAATKFPRLVHGNKEICPWVTAKYFNKIKSCQAEKLLTVVFGTKLSSI